MRNTEAAGPPARERLLAAPSEFFYRERVQTVGIDRIISHARVAKASLYGNFGSKEELVRAYLQSYHSATSERISRALTRFRTSRERLLGVFDAQGEQFTDPAFNAEAIRGSSPFPAT
jgi:AcrR family transcriptional regulator